MDRYSTQTKNRTQLGRNEENDTHSTDLNSLTKIKQEYFKGSKRETVNEGSKAYLGDPNMHRSESDIFQLVVMKDMDDKMKQAVKQGFVPNSNLQPLYKNEKELAQLF